MSSCIRAITHLGLHIVALKVSEVSSLLNFHVCWYAHFILILLTQTAGDTSVNKKAANHVCFFWFGFFKLLMISAVYNTILHDAKCHKLARNFFRFTVGHFSSCHHNIADLVSLGFDVS
ncbi:unnamed protein product [Mucor circinelloides]